MTRDHIRKVLLGKAEETAKRPGYCEADIPEIQMTEAIWDLSCALYALANPGDAVAKRYTQILLERYRQ